MKQLNYRKICSWWLPHILTDDYKCQWVEACEQLLERYRQEGDDFILNIVMGDES